MRGGNAAEHALRSDQDQRSEDGIEVLRMTDKGDAAVSVNHKRTWKSERKARFLPELFHFACAVDPDPEVQLRDVFRQPWVHMRLSLIGSCSPFFCSHANDLQPSVPVFLLQLYQIEHRRHTKSTRGGKKFEDVDFAGLAVREGLPPIQFCALIAGAGDSIDRCILRILLFLVCPPHIRARRWSSDENTARATSKRAL